MIAWSRRLALPRTVSVSPRIPSPLTRFQPSNARPHRPQLRAMSIRSFVKQIGWEAKWKDFRDPNHWKATPSRVRTYNFVQTELNERGWTEKERQGFLELTKFISFLVQIFGRLWVFVMVVRVVRWTIGLSSKEKGNVGTADMVIELNKRIAELEELLETERRMD